MQLAQHSKCHFIVMLRQAGNVRGHENVVVVTGVVIAISILLLLLLVLCILRSLLSFITVDDDDDDVVFAVFCFVILIWLEVSS